MSKHLLLPIIPKSKNLQRPYSCAATYSRSWSRASVVSSVPKPRSPQSKEASTSWRSDWSFNCFASDYSLSSHSASIWLRSASVRPGLIWNGLSSSGLSILLPCWSSYVSLFLKSFSYHISCHNLWNVETTNMAKLTSMSRFVQSIAWLNSQQASMGTSIPTNGISTSSNPPLSCQYSSYLTYIIRRIISRMLDGGRSGVMWNWTKTFLTIPATFPWNERVVDSNDNILHQVNRRNIIEGSTVVSRTGLASGVDRKRLLGKGNWVGQEFLFW